MRYLVLTLLYFTFSQHCLAQAATECLEKSTNALLAEDQEAFQLQLDSCLMLFCEEDDLKGWMEANKKIARVYRDQLHQPEKALEYLYRAVDSTEFREPRTAEELDALGWLHINIGFTYNEYMDLSKEAVTAYEKAKQVLVGRLGFEDLLVGRYLYKPLANIYTRLGEYKAAEVLHKSYLAICSGEKDPAFQNTREAAKACNDLGILFWTTGQYQKAIEICRRGVGLSGLSHSDKGLLYSTLARAYVDINEYANALKHADQAITDFRKALANDEHPAAKVWLANTLAMRGSIMGNLDRYSDGEIAFAEAEILLKEYHANSNNRDFGKLYANWGDLYQKRGNYEVSLDYYQKSLQVMVPGFTAADILQNPTESQLSAENTLVDAMMGKAEAFAKRFQTSHDLRDLNQALQCHELIFLIETKLRQAYYYESSKLTNLEVSRHRSEAAIELALLGWSATKDQTYKEKALAFAERSKSILLMEAFQKSNAEELAGIPQELLAKEKELQEKIDQAEKERFNARSAEASEEVLQELDNQLLSDRQAYAEWVQQLENQYPKYYNLKYNFHTASLADIRKLLPGDAAMIEYFVGKEVLYTFYISRHQFEILTTPLDFPLKDWVVDFHRNIEGYQHLTNNFEASCETYTKLGVQLYQKLMQPLESLGLAEHLTIIPSGILAFLSFDALLTKEPEMRCHFNEYPYVVKQHNIHYGYSATLQHSLQNAPKNQPAFAGFAPEFSGQGSFQALRYNRRAVEAAQSVLGGELFLGTNASIEKFEEVAGQFGIFHLATHAEANTEAGDFSFIVFANADGGYDSLFVRDLYGLSFQAELIVLSACETALGTLYDGEGVISLARGFLHSGARSVLTTLWSIDDVANRKMMDAFYNNLHDGQSKSLALQQAKLTQIENSDRRGAHPVYWAAFTAVGNMEAVYPSYSWMYLTGGAILSLVLISFFIRRGKKTTAKNSVQQKKNKQSTAKPIYA